MRRRRYVSLLGASVTAAFAGCAGEEAGDTTAPSTNSRTATDPQSSPSGTTAATDPPPSTATGTARPSTTETTPPPETTTRTETKTAEPPSRTTTARSTGAGASATRVVERNVLDTAVRGAEERVPPGDWHTLVHEGPGTSVDALYVKFHPGQADEARTLLEHHLPAVPDTREELPYDFSLSAFEYYLFESPALDATTRSYPDSGTIYLPTRSFFPETGYTGVSVGGDAGYQVLVTHEWAGVIIYSIRARERVSFRYPSWFGQGFEMVISEAWPYATEEVFSAVSAGEVPALDTNPYLWGMWATYYIQARYGRSVPPALVRSAAASFADAFERETGQALSAFQADFEQWLVSSFDRALFQRVVDSGGDYLAPT